MGWYEETFGVGADAAAPNANVFVRGRARVSVITPRLLRVETDVFTDRPTQGVLNRDLGPVSAALCENGGRFAVKTDAAAFTFDARGTLLSVAFADGAVVTDFDRGNLKGTARTLDMTDGRVKLGDGVVSRSGVALLDDTRSLLLTPDGTLAARSPGGRDLYVFAYGSDYRAAVRDYCAVTGKQPLLPRFVFGVWWSRYHAYTQQEYLDLMDAFARREIPLTVATVDMDWHWVDVKKRFGADACAVTPKKGVVNKVVGAFQASGWTGYSWNTELFPDYRAFLAALHEKGLRVTLNLHPADGVRRFEDRYGDFCRFLGRDPARGEPIFFDLTDKAFVEGYFKYLHHPYEDDGVDFWWIDWQQGTTSQMDGLDNLWMLNHLHARDMAARGKRPLILSRFAGTGSQRYPLGFSGDSVISWRSLALQPYFTATASNIGFGQWSHDIRGHTMGVRDDELYARWVWFGAFSPILRLHSTNDPFNGKEPWKYGESACRSAVNALRLRHRLIPFLYSRSAAAAEEGRMLVEPMYYEYPDDEQAYEAKNQYLFGGQLLVAPITRKSDGVTRMGYADVWLPEGRWTDVFTGQIYPGGQVVPMFRGLSSIPVLARAGSILVLGPAKGLDPAPDALEVRAWRGDGAFTLYEDDGESRAFELGCCAKTRIAVRETNDRLTLTIAPAEGDAAVLPSSRDWTLVFPDTASCAGVTVTIGGRRAAGRAEKTGAGVRIRVTGVKPDEKVVVTLRGVVPTVNQPLREALIDRISAFQGGNVAKAAVFRGVPDHPERVRRLPPGPAKKALEELLALAGN